MGNPAHLHSERLYMRSGMRETLQIGTHGRRWGLAAAALLVLTSCGSSGSRFLANTDEKVYLRVPTSWHDVLLSKSVPDPLLQATSDAKLIVEVGRLDTGGCSRAEGPRRRLADRDDDASTRPPVRSTSSCRRHWPGAPSDWSRSTRCCRAARTTVCRKFSTSTQRRRTPRSAGRAWCTACAATRRRIGCSQSISRRSSTPRSRGCTRSKWCAARVLRQVDRRDQQDRQLLEDRIAMRETNDLLEDEDRQ